MGILGSRTEWAYCTNYNRPAIDLLVGSAVTPQNYNGPVLVHRTALLE